MRVQDRCAAPGAVVEKPGSAQYTKEMLFEDMRKIAAERTESILTWIFHLVGQQTSTLLYYATMTCSRLWKGVQEWAEHCISTDNRGRTFLCVRERIASGFSAGNRVFPRRGILELPPLFEIPYSRARLGRPYERLFRSKLDSRKIVLGATVIAEFPVGMKDRLAASFALFDKLRAAPDTIVLALRRRRKDTALGADPIFVGRH